MPDELNELNDPDEPQAGWEPLDSDVLAAAGTELLVAAIHDDRERIAQLFIEIGERFGPKGAYVLCCGIATMVIMIGRKIGVFAEPDHAGHDIRDGKNEQCQACNGYWAFQVIDTDTDEPVDPAQADAGTQTLVAGQRFVIAQINDDDEQAKALFLADPVGVCAGTVQLAGLFGRQLYDDDHDDHDDHDRNGGDGS